MNAQRIPCCVVVLYRKIALAFFTTHIFIVLYVFVTVFLYIMCPLHLQL